MKARNLSLRSTQWIILGAFGLFCAFALSGLLPSARMQEKKVASPVAIAPGPVSGGQGQVLFQGSSTPEASGTFPGTGVGPITDSPAGGNLCGDYTAAPLNVSFAVSGISANITKVSVGFTLAAPAHTWVGDLKVTLLAPGGAPSANIFSQTGSTTATGCGDDSDVTGPYTFADVATNNWFAAATTAGSAVAVAPGLYRTSTAGGVVGGGVNSSIDAVFAGLTPAQANGNWVLRFEDGGQGDTGTVSAATLTVFQPTAASGVVSGRISDGGGAAVAGTVIHLSGGQSRIAISDADGHYQFNDVDTNGFYTAAPSRANYTFNPGDRSFSMVGNQTNTDFGGQYGGDFANPADTAEYFVRQQYLDFLGREPDEGGLAFWSSRINSCNGDAACMRQQRIDVSAAFFMSGEFQQSGSYVYDMYAGLLGRTPGYNEFTPDRAQVVGGNGLDAAKTAFAQNFVQRSEFTSRYPVSMTRDQFVDAVITSMQVRSGMFMTELRDGLISDYDNGGRALVARHAAEAPMFVNAEYNRAFVLMEYFGYLRRGEDTNGYQFWLNVLNQGSGNDYRGMVCSFLTSTEYQGRFSSVISHGNGECSQ